MIIQCINCNVKYNIDGSKINPPGKKVKCSKCGELFFVEKNATHEEVLSQTTSVTEESSAQIKSTLENQQQEDSTSVSVKSFDDNKIEKDSGINESPDAKTEEVQLEIDIDDESNSNDLKGDVSSTEVEDLDSDNNLEINDDHKNPKDEVIEDTEQVPSASDEIEQVSFEVAASEDNETHQVPENADVKEIQDEGSLDDDIDWENLEIEQFEKNGDEQDRRTLTDSDAELPEGDLELNSSRDKINKDKEKRDSQNPFRAPSLTPDISDDFSNYNIVSDAASAKEKGTRAPSVYSSAPHAQKKSFLSRFFVNLAIFVVLVIVFTTALFSLITFGVIPRDEYSKYLSFMSKYLPSIEKVENTKLKDVEIKNLTGEWINTRNGFLYIVYGEALNNSNKTVNYIKLKSKYSSAGKVLYTQEFYSGNTLTLTELRNNSVSELERKLKRKTGDVDFDDIDTFAGKNFNIEPGKSVPFYTFYLSKRKILGLKYEIEVLDFETLGL